MTASTEARTVSIDTLRVYLPVGATVFATITGTRRNRKGATVTTMSLFTLDGDNGYPVVLSGLIARVTGDTVVPAELGNGVRLATQSGGHVASAVHQVIGELAVRLHGSSTALRSHIL